MIQSNYNFFKKKITTLQKENAIKDYNSQIKKMQYKIAKQITTSLKK